MPTSPALEHQHASLDSDLSAVSAFAPNLTEAALVMRLVSEDALWDTITSLGMMICFYYGLTAFACVWYFRHQWFDSMRNTTFMLLFPLIGGTILTILFFTTLYDSMDPSYGSGSSLFGLGLVFVLGVTVLLLGVVLMLIESRRKPAFFRSETLSREAPASIGRGRPN